MLLAYKHADVYTHVPKHSHGKGNVRHGAPTCLLSGSSAALLIVALATTCLVIMSNRSITVGKQLVELPEPQLRHFHGENGFSDLPLKPVSNAATSKLKHVFDVLEIYPDLAVDKDVLLRKVQEQDYDSLPEQLAVKNIAEKLTSLQIIYVSGVAEGEPHRFVKILTFQDRLAVPLIKPHCHGKLMFLDYGNRFKQGMSLFHQSLDSVKGWGIVNYMLQPASKATGPLKNEASLQAGFDFIRENGPRSNCNNRQTEWTEIEIHRDDSPIFGWSASLVEKSLKGYASANLFAEPVTNYFLTLHDLRPWFLHDVIVPLLPHLKDKSLVFMGLAETGKTPAAQAIAMSMSEYWVLRDGLNDVAPSYRIAASLDQFRGEPGLKHRPGILDDADVSTIPPTKMKAFLDQSLEEAFTVERWTAAKFVRNQLRIVCVIRLQKNGFPKIVCIQLV